MKARKEEGQSEGIISGPWAINIELSLLNRFSLLNVLPKEGNIITMRTVADLRRQLSLTDKEISEWGVTMNGESVQWDNSKDNNRKMNFSLSAIGVITSELKKLNEQSPPKLTIDLVEVWDKFIKE